MKISVFTPLYAPGNKFIAETYASLLEQTHTDWEWVVLVNNGGVPTPEMLADERVRIVNLGAVIAGIGFLKAEACAACTGDVLLELDHDDLLREDALFHVATAFANGADFVYSDFAEFKVLDSVAWESNAYGTGWGWVPYVARYKGHDLLAMHAPTDPVAWRRIVWAPNHLRAWRRSTYLELGGHDRTMTFADDHDLVLRTYLSGAKCAHIPECLYFYRLHEQNNVRTRNWDIQVAATQVYDRYINQLAEHVARETPYPLTARQIAEGKIGRADGKHLRLIDVCGGIDTAKGYEPWDLSLGHDLNQRWPADDSTVGVLRAHDAIEHLQDKVHTMNEAYRVLAPGGFLLIMVPSTDAMIINHGDGRNELINGSGAYCDPTHVSFWNAMSFRYYTDAFFAKYCPDIRCRFQVSTLETVNCNGIPYVRAELIALKPGYVPMGETRI